MKPKIIFITNIDYIVADRDMIEIMEMNPVSGLEVMTNEGANWVETATVQKEIMRATRFRNPARNIDVMIGTSKRVADFLGIQFNCWESMNDTISSTMKENSCLRTKVETDHAKQWWDLFYASVELRWKVIDDKIDAACEKAKRDMHEILRPKMISPKELQPGVLHWVPKEEPIGGTQLFILPQKKVAFDCCEIIGS